MSFLASSSRRRVKPSKVNTLRSAQTLLTRRTAINFPVSKTQPALLLNRQSFTPRKPASPSLSRRRNSALRIDLKRSSTKTIQQSLFCVMVRQPAIKLISSRPSFSHTPYLQVPTSVTQVFGSFTVHQLQQLVKLVVGLPRAFQTPLSTTFTSGALYTTLGLNYLTAPIYESVSSLPLRMTGYSATFTTALSLAALASATGNTN